MKSEHRGRRPNEPRRYDFLHGLGFTGERETEVRGSRGAVISGTVSTRETSTQTPDTRLWCGPSFFFLCAKGESECSGSLLRDPQEMVEQCGRVGMPRVTPLGKEVTCAEQVWVTQQNPPSAKSVHTVDTA